MSDNIPFEIQSEIITRLPIKPLIQFRSVSKAWKSLIDSSEFIANYHVRETQPSQHHHLLVSYTDTNNNSVENYVSIADNDTFPQHTFHLTAPASVKPHEVKYVLGFTKSGEAIIEMGNDLEKDALFVYEPNSENATHIGITGKPYSCNVSSYMETLLLLDH